MFNRKKIKELENRIDDLQAVIKKICSHDWKPEVEVLVRIKEILYLKKCKICGYSLYISKAEHENLVIVYELSNLWENKTKIDKRIEEIEEIEESKGKSE